jgi:F-type H+-transporting ATPase subunit delta
MDTAQAEAYATALYAVANAEGQLDAVGDQLFAVGQAVDGNDELRNALGDPHLPVARRQQIVEDVLGDKMSDVTVGLVSMVVAAGRGRDLPVIVDALLKASSSEQGRQVAEIRSAIGLSDDQQTRLAAALKSATGHDVDVRVTVDPSIEGGIIARVGDTVIDGSVRHRLGQLRDALRTVA